MRVTELGRFDLISQRLSNLRSQHQDAAKQATTGQRINAPSDDPTAAAEAARLRAGISQARSSQRTIDLVKGDVQMAESSLAEAGDVMQRALEIAMLGGNEANGTDQRKSLSIEAGELVSQLVEIGNTKGSQGYLFSGTALDQPAFAADGTFQGNDAEHQVDTGAGTPLAVNVSGARAFTAVGGTDAVAALQALTAALATDDPAAVRSSLGNLQAAHKQIVQERSHAGLIINRIELGENILTDAHVLLTDRDRQVTGAKADEVYSKLVQLEGAINDSVTVGKRLLDLSSLQRF